MFNFGKKIEKKNMEINEGYKSFIESNGHHYMLCVDEVFQFDKAHMVDAECFPFRLITEMEEYYPEKDKTYYVYSLNKALSEKAAIKLLKKGYNVFDLGAYYLYRGPEAGLEIKKKAKRKK